MNCRKLESRKIAMGEAAVFLSFFLFLFKDLVFLERVVTGCNYWVVVGSGKGGGWNWLPWSAKTGVSKGTTGRQNRQNYNSKLRLFHGKLTREG